MDLAEAFVEKALSMLGINTPRRHFAGFIFANEAAAHAAELHFLRNSPVYSALLRGADGG